MDFSCRVCCIDQYIKIPPSTVCQDLVCHLVTDFAIRSLCHFCTLKNPPGLGRTLLLLSPSEELLWLIGTKCFVLTQVTPVFQTHGNLGHVSSLNGRIWHLFLQRLSGSSTCFPLNASGVCYAMGYPFLVAFWYLFLVTHPPVGALAAVKHKKFCFRNSSRFGLMVA